MRVPTTEDIRLEAFRRWERRGGGDGHDLFDYHEARRDLVLCLNYAPVEPTYQFVGPRRNIGVRGAACRYCGRSAPEVKFKTTAHAIPEFLGNTALVDLNECDACNAHFSQTAETNLAEFLGPLRTVLGLGGKEGIPRYRHGESHVESDGAKVTVHNRAASPLVRGLDQEGATAELGMPVKSYRPILVYKCLAKMALALMPAEDAARFGRTRQWLIAEDPEHQAGLFADHFAYAFFVPGPSPFADPWARLYRRRDDAAALPHVLFAYGWANLALQIFLPLSDKDDFLTGHRILVPRLGLLTGPGSEFGASTVEQIPLGSPRKERGTSVGVTFRAGTVEDLP